MKHKPQAVRIVYLICITLFFITGNSHQAISQLSGIQFKKLNWEQALDVAKKENKFLFIDVHSSMRNDEVQNELEQGVFQADTIARFFNSNFISIKVDMGAKENHSFASKLQSLMYPVYLFLAENGDQIGFISPYTIKKDPSKLIVSAGKAINRGLVKRKNTKKIEFEKLTWEEAKANAKKENKLIFFDAYTDWCRPCIQMDKDIFTLDEVADFFNENFINLKTNAEKGEGPAIRKKYGIKAFPTFLFTDAEGNLVFRDSGYKDKDTFMAVAKKATSNYAYQSINFILQDLDKAKQYAKAENKLILFDAYTSWCAPCKQMDKNIFTQYDVAKYYNDEYISVKYDMEKGDGVDLKLTYQVTVFPTYLVLDHNGNVLHQAVGAMPAKDFIKFGKTGKSGLNLSAMKASYKAGKRNIEFVLRYIDVLKKANLNDEMNNVADTYFMTLEEADRFSAQTWTFVENYILTPNAATIKYIIKNRKKFTTHFGDKVDAKLYKVYLSNAKKFAQINAEKKLVSYDEKGFQKYLKQVKQLSLKRYDELVAYAWIDSYRTRANWKSYTEAIDKYMNAKTIDKGILSIYNYALVVEQNCEDANLRKKAWHWLVVAESYAPDYYKDSIAQLKQKLIAAKVDSQVEKQTVN